MRRILVLSSSFSLICGCWLAAMEMVLRHPGHVTRVVLASCIALISVATLWVSVFPRKIWGERSLLTVPAIALLFIGVQAFVHNASAAHFEGFVVVISSALVFQGILMLLSPLAPGPDTIQSK
jgi:hypothetical protein